jgi:formate hydrogenlyase subunit 3/multisubunit Na+/H+ antiporter MnhD subunit
LVLPRYLEADVVADGVATASVLGILGFGILLMMPPFHGQLVAAAAYTAPMTSTLVLTSFPPLAFYVFALLGQAYPALFQDNFFFEICRWLGIGAVVLGGIAAVGQRQWGGLVGYAALVDWGAGLIALGQGTSAGLLQATQMLIWRPFSLLLTGSGMSALFQATGKSDDLEHCGGLFYHRPMNVLALVIGLFSLAGFPLTPGAMGRVPLIQSLMASDAQAAWVLILAGAGVMIGTLGGLRTCIDRPRVDLEQAVKQSRSGEITGFAFGLLAWWLVGWLFSRSMLWTDILQRVLSEFTFLQG